MVTGFNDFVHDTSYEDIPLATRGFARRCLLDLIAVAAAGSTTPLAGIMREHALDHFGAGRKASRLLFDGRSVSPAGAALVNATMIDSMDAHDGHKLTKGHVGCALLPSLLAFVEAENKLDERELITALVIGYELGTRAGIALHASVSDYHTSGAWMALACAALGARYLGLDVAQTREAVGIAEYHGPRSQMMRVIDAPTMLKDGSGWGALAGVSAAYLAAQGYTGAPAITIEAAQHVELWGDLGSRWRIHEQYFKPYPVCRWAQPPVEAALQLCREHDISTEMIECIEVSSFHEARRLATALPQTTEQAQYSLPFATAAALVFQQLGPEQVGPAAMAHIEVQRLAASMRLSEDDEFNHAFPAQRFARVSLLTKQGVRYTSPATEARGDPEAPLSDAEIHQKFHRFSDGILGKARADQIETAVTELGKGESLTQLLELIITPARAK